MTTLSVQGLNTFYGQSQALRDLSLSVSGGEVLCLLGRNGAGKTTALRSIMGTLKPASGRVELDGALLSGLPPEQIPQRGLGYVPQGRRLFSELTVMENLQIGLRARGSGSDALEDVFSLLPVLRERLQQRSGTLSGGEQTMLAVARALCLQPKVLMLDEPTEGLMPSAVAAIRDALAKLRGQGVAILLVEQRVGAVLAIADRVAFMTHGQIEATHSVQEVRQDHSLIQRYVGISA